MNSSAESEKNRLYFEKIEAHQSYQTLQHLVKAAQNCVNDLHRRDHHGICLRCPTNMQKLHSLVLVCMEKSLSHFRTAERRLRQGGA